MSSPPSAHLSASHPHAADPSHAAPKATPRRVLVTGGAARLGAEICRQFAQAGWEVWIHYQRSADAAQALAAQLNTLSAQAGSGLKAHTIQADLALASERAAMFAQAEAQGVRWDCVVNNASLFEPDSAASFDMVQARQQMEVNLLAPLELSSLLANSVPPDAAPGACSVIHILDQKVFNLNPDYFSYTVSKLALERSVALQAQALAPRLRVCGVAPGLMFLSGPQTQENFDQASRVNLMQQALDPAQVAATCVFLATNTAITGVSVAVDNGQHLVPLRRDVMFAIQENPA